MHSCHIHNTVLAYFHISTHIRFRSKTLPYITLTAWKYCKAVNNEAKYQIVNIDNMHGLTYKVQCEVLNTKVRLY